MFSAQQRRLHRFTVRTCTVGVLLFTVGCDGGDGEMFNCLLAPDVPPIVVKGESATDANRKCEQEQGQACTCTAVRPYNTIVGPQ